MTLPAPPSTAGLLVRHQLGAAVSRASAITSASVIAWPSAQVAVAFSQEAPDGRAPANARGVLPSPEQPPCRREDGSRFLGLGARSWRRPRRRATRSIRLLIRLTCVAFVSACLMRPWLAAPAFTEEPPGSPIAVSPVAVDVVTLPSSRGATAGSAGGAGTSDQARPSSLAA